MADAKKCDRCGSFYDRIALPNSNYLLSKYCKDVDLCPECSKLLNLWMEDKIVFMSIDEFLLKCDPNEGG